MIFNIKKLNKMLKNRIQLSLILIFISSFVFSQSKTGDFTAKVLKHREKYKRDLVRDLHSPLTKYDLRFIQFYEPDSSYRVKCRVTPLKNQDFFDFLTSSGQKRKYRKFTKLSCEVKDTAFVLFTYESKKLLATKKYKDYIFLPFTDYTNGESTYGGGRYLDLNRNEFSSDSIVVDFNLCYNPYCAYSAGYSCAIPPRENAIPMYIKAGEKLYTGQKKHRKNSKIYKKRQDEKLRKHKEKLKKRAEKSIRKKSKNTPVKLKTKVNPTDSRYFEPGHDTLKIQKK